MYTVCVGAGDDEESWSHGLTPALLWESYDRLLNSGADGIHACVKQLLAEQAYQRCFGQLCLSNSGGGNESPRSILHTAAASGTLQCGATTAAVRAFALPSKSVSAMTDRHHPSPLGCSNASSTTSSRCQAGSMYWVGDTGMALGDLQSAAAPEVWRHVDAVLCCGPLLNSTLLKEWQATQLKNSMPCKPKAVASHNEKTLVDDFHANSTEPQSLSTPWFTSYNCDSLAQLDSSSQQVDDESVIRHSLHSKPAAEGALPVPQNSMLSDLLKCHKQSVEHGMLEPACAKGACIQRDMLPPPDGISQKKLDHLQHVSKSSNSSIHHELTCQRVRIHPIGSDHSSSSASSCEYDSASSEPCNDSSSTSDAADVPGAQGPHALLLDGGSSPVASCCGSNSLNRLLWLPIESSKVNRLSLKDHLDAALEFLSAHLAARHRVLIHDTDGEHCAYQLLRSDNVACCSWLLQSVVPTHS